MENQKRITLDMLRAASAGKKETDLSQLPFFRMAALRSVFTMPDIGRETQELFVYKMDRADRELLAENCLDLETEGQYMLDDDIRIEVLGNWQQAGQLREFLRDHSLSGYNELENILLDYLTPRRNPLPLKEQNLTQLTATHRIAGWVHPAEPHPSGFSIPGVPRPEVIHALIERHELLAPFHLLTKNFQGRLKELARLRVYVEWLPQKKWYQRASKFLRGIIKWRDKPPLLISGIGGVGKSTLVAKFLVDYSAFDRQGRIPFIYLDFDKPGLAIAEPLTLADEALRQLAIQFPDQQLAGRRDGPKLSDIFRDIRLDIRTTMRSQGWEIIEKQTRSRSLSQRPSRSTAATRSNLYESIRRQYLNQYEEALKLSDIPVLIILDSFEEAQKRASISDIGNLFRFIEEIGGQVPRLRLIIVGRSDLINTGIKLANMPLGDFDRKAAVGYLAAQGIKNEELARNIHARLGGNPLTLQLAARYIQNEQQEQPGKALNVDMLLRNINKQRIQEQLVRRNLYHIKDPDARKVAFPGLLVRHISPEIIQKVLAEPCKLGKITKEKATQIFDKLQEAAFLLKPEHGRLVFRRDLRMTLYELILEEYGDRARAIQDNAINYYQKKKDPADRAEYLYHRLKRGDDPALVLEGYQSELRPYLENALPELPLNAYIYLANKLGIQVAPDMIENAVLADWEVYMAGQIEDVLVNGEEADLQALIKRLQAREERTGQEPLAYFEAKLHLRLGHFIKVQEIINRSHQHSRLTLRQYVLGMQIQEYQRNIKDAGIPFGKSVDPLTLPADLPDVIEYLIQHIRLERRKGTPKDTILEQNRPMYDSLLARYPLNTILESAREDKLLPLPYRYYNEMIVEVLSRLKNQRWMILVELETIIGYPLRQSLFRAIYDQIQNQRKPLSFIESRLNNRFKFSLRNISEAGSLEVVAADLVCFLEVEYRGDVGRIMTDFFELKSRSGSIGQGSQIGSVVDRDSSSRQTEHEELKKLLEQARQLLMKGRLEEAIKLVMDSKHRKVNRFEKELILLLNRFKSHEQRSFKGTITATEHMVNVNRVTSDFLYLLQEIENS